MIRNKNHALLAILISTLFFLSSNVFAETATDLKERMKARLPEINQLKDSGVIGETYTGFLSIIGSASDNAVVSAENDDRKKVYSAIAKQQGTTPDLVGNRRALQIYQNAAPGTLLQDDKGTWYKK
nr:YdbL family protein [Desulfobulbaceae bacterium]